MKKIKITFFTFLLIGLGFYLFFKEGAMAVNKTNPQTKIFIIKKGESLSGIINNLADQELIRNRLVFYLVVKRLGIERKIQAGDFRLSQSKNAYEIAKGLTHGTLDTWVTIIEGLRKEEVAHIIAKEFDIPEKEFLKTAQEGSLFPDTYLIQKNASAKDIIKILNNNFNKKFSQKLRNIALKKGLDENKVLILASLVEREAKSKEDKQKVASILLKRYRQSWPLQIDATIQYILGYQSDEKDWWKKNLSEEDIKVDSPYNTYRNQGLPPGPICSPGLDSIKAVVYSDEDTPYWYYISDKRGRLHLSKTLEEHNKNIKKYLR